MMTEVLYLAEDEEQNINLNPKQLQVREREKVQRPDRDRFTCCTAFWIMYKQFCYAASGAPIIKTGCCLAFYKKKKQP